ncbi:hypothetical protein AT959_01415 [Dechloromonas denitrificans]|uniref:Uncharacterized protein n=1 Tax=Dechloromonas denitrificans TaxID=281362 RepID=A0A133XN67_9RHOO|nr:hypothetical protein [Dechloromonas denitrificans]KXB32381.1 hypothetical protein AT959_01415 [Dechloromonas denitrificans]
MKTVRSLTLNFIDGKKMSFEFPEQVEINAARQLMLKSLWESDRLVVEVDGDFLIFPMSNIRYFQISVPGALEEQLKLPSHTIYGASIVG